jgi:hypothetical protein
MGKNNFMTAGEFARKIDVPYTTVATWLRKGQVPGAVAQTIGDFRVWMIPVETAIGFKRPKRGRPKKAGESKAMKTEKPSKKTTKKRTQKAVSESRKSGKK